MARLATNVDLGPGGLEGPALDIIVLLQIGRMAPCTLVLAP